MENSITINACSPPSCSCPELELTQDIDGNDIAIINDDFGGVVYLTLKELEILVEKFKALKTGE